MNIEEKLLVIFDSTNFKYLKKSVIRSLFLVKANSSSMKEIMHFVQNIMLFAKEVYLQFYFLLLFSTQKNNFNRAHIKIKRRWSSFVNDLEHWNKMDLLNLMNKSYEDFKNSNPDIKFTTKIGIKNNIIEFRFFDFEKIKAHLKNNTKKINGLSFVIFNEIKKVMVFYLMMGLNRNFYVLKNGIIGLSKAILQKIGDITEIFCLQLLISYKIKNRINSKDIEMDNDYLFKIFEQVY